jgi:transcriptional regulator with XRE-family HTH domain
MGFPALTHTTSGAYRHHSKSGGQGGTSTVNDKAAGTRLRRYIREGMAAREIDSLSELARRSGTGRDTLQAWMRGERPPSTAAGTKVAAELGSSYHEMLRAWEGDDATGFDRDELVAALEFAIRLIRTGQVPPEVQAEVDAARRSASQRKSRRRRPTAG